MADSKITDYVRTQLAQGFSPEEVKQALISSGWNPIDIDKALSTASSQKPTQNPPTQPPQAPPQPIQSTQPSQNKPKPAQPKPAKPPQAQVPAPIQPSQPAQTPSAPEQKPPKPGQAQPPPANQQAQPPQSPPQPTGQPGQDMSIGILRKFLMILIHPNQFFQSVKTEQGFAGPIKYFLLLMLLTILFSNILMYVSESMGAFFFPSPFANPLMAFLQTESINNLFNANLFLIINIGIFAAIATLLHIFLRILGGGGGLSDSLRTVIYSYTPFPVLMAISIPVYALFTMSLESVQAIPTLTLDLATIFELPVFIYIQFVMLLVFLAWSLFLAIKSSSMFHGISGVKALVTIIIVIAVLAVIAVVLSMTLLIPPPA